MFADSTPSAATNDEVNSAADDITNAWNRVVDDTNDWAKLGLCSAVTWTIPARFAEDRSPGVRLRRLVPAGRSPIEGVTNHSLRRTFASLLYEAGASPAYVMAQMGHSDAALALEIDAKVMERKRDTGARMDALVRGADWARMGTNGAQGIEATSTLATEHRAGAGLF